MTFLRTGAEGPDVVWCAYAGSRLRYRGPARSLEGGYVAALGGAATFGKGVARPWPQMLEATTGHRLVNFGAVGAGPEALLHDPGLLAACRGATAVVIEMGGAGCVSSDFYRVHPRRNDRLVATGPALQALFPGVELCEVAFTGHLLATLHARDPAAFATLAKVLRRTWTARMQEVLDRLEGAGPVVLLWLGKARPGASAPRGARPALITPAAIAPLRTRAAAVVEGVGRGPQVDAMPGAAAHEAAAVALADVILQLCGPAPAPRRATG